ncbi:hypothetical protein IKE71_00515 [Candidatus Saccharibacteria bacterium]|nr:hypothetical protein [Candidatus Saccharibacteria bacterium]
MENEPPAASSSATEVASVEITPLEEPATLVEQDKKVEKKKGKKHLSSNAKLGIIISAIVAVVTAVVLVLVFVVFRKEEPEVALSERELLIAHAWEKEGAPTVIWTFRKDGTGELTTNKSNYYDMKWNLEQEEGANSFKLKITTDWLYELEDDFLLEFDRENDKLMLKNLADDGESTFVALGTAETRPEETPEEES